MNSGPIASRLPAMSLSLNCSIRDGSPDVVPSETPEVSGSTADGSSDASFRARRAAAIASCDARPMPLGGRRSMSPRGSKLFTTTPMPVTTTRGRDSIGQTSIDALTVQMDVPLRTLARSPTIGLLAGLIVTLVAVVADGRYITRQKVGLRALQTDL